jgi:hypothetical protein
MIIDQSELVTVAGALVNTHVRDQARLRRIDKYMRNKPDPPFAPKGASSEYRWLMQRGKRNFLPLIVSVISQNLHVDGYRRSGITTADTPDQENTPEWDAFRANRFISRQHGVHRAVMKHGLAYVVVLPGQMAVGEQVKDAPLMRACSARRMIALYTDPVNDEWPQVAMERLDVYDPKVTGKRRLIVTIYDEQNRYIMTGVPGNNTQPLQLADPDDPYLDGKPPVSAHNMGLVPVVRFLYEDDLDGEDVVGEVEPLMTIQDQINFFTFNEMLTTQFAAFRQRWVSGMASEDEGGRPTEPFKPGVDRIWASDDPGTKFGEFDVSPLQPFDQARESGIRHMSTVSQVPPYHLLGQIANLSAEALAAARDGLDRKVEEEQAMMVDSWRNVFRLNAKAVNDDVGWSDMNGVVLWRDTSARSFAATIDALGKAASMLGVPVEELWRRIPGVTADDIESWLEARARAEAQATAAEAAKVALAVQTQMLGSPYPPPPAPPGGAPGPAGPSGPGQGPEPQNGAQSQVTKPAPGGSSAAALIAQSKRMLNSPGGGSST